MEIKITQATLFLTARELLDVLPRELFALALQRGKAITRRRRMDEREGGREHGDTGEALSRRGVLGG
ncbi:MAG: hypothetical protein Q8P50_15185 [Bacillota bacterium]|nr:hypothetical protein [Bacillota bacterium]